MNQPDPTMPARNAVERLQESRGDVEMARIALLKENARLRAINAELMEAIYGFQGYGSCVCECGHPACKLCQITEDAKQAIAHATGQSAEEANK